MLPCVLWAYGYRAKIKKTLTDYHSKHADPTADTSKEERTIDLMVYKLYGLTYDEVMVVDPETTITEEEYEREISKQLWVD